MSVEKSQVEMEGNGRQMMKQTAQAKKEN